MYVPCPYSIYEGIFKLEPGCILKISSHPPKTKPDHLPHSSSASEFRHSSLVISEVV